MKTFFLILFLLQSLAHSGLYLIIKVGDQPTAPGKEHLGMKDGYIVTAIETKTPETYFSDHMKKVYSIFQIDLDLKDSLPKWMAPRGNIANSINYRARSKQIFLDSLEKKAGYEGYVKDLRSTKSVPIIDAQLFITKDDFKSTAIRGPPMPDSNAVSSGTYTVGSGGDYTDWPAAAADVANQDDDLRFDQISSFSLAAQSTFSQNLAGNTFTLSSTADHLGDPTKGNVTTYSSALAIGILVTPEGPGTVNINKLFFKNSSGMSANGRYMEFSAITTGFTANVSDILFDCTNTTSNFWTFYPNDVDLILNMWNCKVWASKQISMLIANCASTSVIENCVIDQTATVTTDFGFYINSLAITLRNNVCIGATHDFYLIASATGRNNACEGTTCEDGDFSTGSDNTASIAPADEFSSLTNTDADYLDIKSDAPTIKTGGIAPGIAGNTAGIETNIRPDSESNISVGPHQNLVASTASSNEAHNGSFKNNKKSDSFKRGSFRRGTWRGTK